MRLILKEKKTLKEQNSSQEMLVEMKSADFLKLTSDEGIMDYLKSRFKLSPMDYSASKADKLFLLVDENGKVISHEGRNRSYANIQKNGEYAMQKVIIRTERGDINKIDTLYGQFNPSAAVKVSSLQKIKYEQSAEMPEDILEIGNEPVSFVTEIWRKGYVYPNGKVLDQDYVRQDGPKEAIIFLNQIYQKLYRVLKKKNGWGEYEIHHNEVADEADKYVTEKYTVTDEQGTLNLKMNRKGYFRMEFDREPVGTITVRKK